MQTDMNQRERDKYANGIRHAAELLAMVGRNIEEGNDGTAIISAGLFNVFLLSMWDEVNDIFSDAAKLHNHIADQLSEVTIPDALPPDFEA